MSSFLLRHLSNIAGWRTSRKLIVFESDDWGSIRMPSTEAYNNLMREGIDLTSDEGARFNLNDSLASSEDLNFLFETLDKYTDTTGRPAVITPISVVANPDFRKIRESDFKEYYFEPFTETLKRYPGCENSFNIWKEGLLNRLFVPQFHGREHLNVTAWMRALRINNNRVLHAFTNEMWGISTADDPEIGIELQAAFDLIDERDVEYQKEVITSGLKIFEELFGFRASYFVPPNGPFSSKLESTCLRSGIKYLSTPKIHSEPLNKGLFNRKIHWMGQQMKTGLICITRNGFFEPSLPGKDWVDSCLSDISIAFNWQKPAVISSHRVNYIGTLNKANRDRGLLSLQSLLKKIKKIWPEAEFVTSDELGAIIERCKRH
jgi:hypothetical protein